MNYLYHTTHTISAVRSMYNVQSFQIVIMHWILRWMGKKEEFEELKYSKWNGLNLTFVSQMTWNDQL